MRRAILEALEARFQAQVSEAEATIKIYLENSVGIGEHPQHIDEIDKQLQRISEAEEKLEALKRFKTERVAL
jgi:hypothetical protein